ncbi:hypothetical protein Poly59_25320 [Rubripirellula reticaptiva]|uniref:Uncharacterized protein n=1 Tax=Rubripirellula reticaptiva TaxID=2528013 RepID=A0A5C6F4E8_9BACT|nr:hypothetical protein Poly59_25320 [Rubripirellula reticaptiva]
MRSKSRLGRHDICIREVGCLNLKNPMIRAKSKSRAKRSTAVGGRTILVRIRCSSPRKKYYVVDERYGSITQAMFTVCG